MHNDGNIEDWILECLHGIATMVGGIIFACFCVWIAINVEDFYARIMISPFLFCSVPIITQGVIQLLKGLNLRKGMSDDDTILDSSVFEKNDRLNILDKICSKLSIVGFLLFWFGFLIIFDYIAITQVESLIFIIVSFPFWVIGILVAIKTFKE
jgi:hypothetical protein